MDPHLRKLQHEIAAALADFSREQLFWHPPGKWCAVEIVEHLYLTYTGTIKGFGRLLEAGKPLAAIPTWKQRRQAWIVVRLGYLPTGREAPAVTRPRGVPADKVLSEIGSAITAMDEIMAGCEARFGARRKVLDHPILGPFSIAQWRKFHLVHGRHHVKQLHRLQALSRTGPLPASMASSS
jgi:hypothetical protein